MVQTCVVVGCKARCNKKFDGTFHSFPWNEPERAVKWITNIKREDKVGKPWKPSKNDRVCSSHFCSEDFEIGTKNKRLKKTAIPSIFPALPCDTDNKIKKGRRKSSPRKIAAKRPPTSPSTDMDEGSSKIMKMDHDYCFEAVDDEVIKTIKDHVKQISAELQSKHKDDRVGSQKFSNMAEAKTLALKAIEKESSNLRQISLDIWENPELCFEEFFAHTILTDYLEAEGFNVERHYKLETAFRATVSSKEIDEFTPTIGVMCEYDALPGIGHACGHNLIAILGLAVAVGIKKALEEGNIKGKLVVLGCPAEEAGGGKIDLINSGAYDDMDIAVMAHPSQFNLPKPVYVAMSQVKVTFHGKASHASSFPWDGINALDAAVLCYQNISCMRQHFKPTWRVHGIITKGGEKPNIIPEIAELLYYARAPTSCDLKELQKRLKGCFDGAAAATGCTVTYEFDPKSYDALMSNDTLASLYINNGKELGIQFENDPSKLLKQGGSTDMGNVSKVLPSIHPKYSINTSVSAHTTEFRDLVKTEPSHNLTLIHAKALALAAIDVYDKPELLAYMKEEFKRQLKAEV